LENIEVMEVSVWDTYVKREDGKRMHFDILVPSSLNDKDTIFEFGNIYLKTKPYKTGKLTTSECRFCHVEEAPKDVVEAISKQGFYILEMQNCD